MDVLSYLFNLTICLTQQETSDHVRLTINKTHSRNNGSAEFGGTFHCSKDECLLVEMEQRCQIKCCSGYCCLPDGPLPYSHSTDFLLGLSSLQIVGIIAGSIALLVLIVAVALLVLRRLVPHCGHMGFAADRQVLVIEGPEEGDSYGEDEDEDEDYGEDELHQVETA